MEATLNQRGEGRGKEKCDKALRNDTTLQWTKGEDAGREAKTRGHGEGMILRQVGRKRFTYPKPLCRSVCCCLSVCFIASCFPFYEVTKHREA